MKWKHKSGNTFNCHEVCSACCFLLRGLWGIMNQCWLVTQVNVYEKFMTSLSWNELLFNRTKFILLLFILILIYNRVFWAHSMWYFIYMYFQIFPKVRTTVWASKCQLTGICYLAACKWVWVCWVFFVGELGLHVVLWFCAFFAFAYNRLMPLSFRQKVCILS